MPNKHSVYYISPFLFYGPNNIYETKSMYLFQIVLRLLQVIWA